MGLVLVMIAGVAFVFIAAPVGLLGFVVLRKSERREASVPAGLTTLVVSVCAQYAYVLAPVIRAGKADFELFILPLFGWHMAPPLLLALVLWFVARAGRNAALLGVISGLLFSIAAVVLLSIPLGFVVPRVFGLKFTP